MLERESWHSKAKKRSDTTGDAFMVLNSSLVFFFLLLLLLFQEQTSFVMLFEVVLGSGEVCGCRAQNQKWGGNWVKRTHTH